MGIVLYLLPVLNPMSYDGEILWVIVVVKGWFNNVIGQEVLNSVAKSDKKGWCKWLVDFFRSRDFDVERDGKVRGRGSANMGVPQGPQWSFSYGWPR